MSKMKGEKMFMSIKINMEKAYQLNSKSKENYLEDCKFPAKLIWMSHHCISFTAYKILWNGEKT